MRRSRPTEKRYCCECARETSSNWMAHVQAGDVSRPRGYLCGYCNGDRRCGHCGARGYGLGKRCTGCGRNPRGAVRREGKRDYQRAKVYAAEDLVFYGYRAGGTRADEGTCGLWEATRLRPFDEIAAYVRRVGGASIDVARRRGRGATATGYYRISFAPDSTRRWIALHELAHLETPDGHGPKFAGYYLALVHQHLDREWGYRLGRAFVDHGVDFDAPPANLLKLDQRAAATLDKPPTANVGCRP